MKRSVVLSLSSTEQETWLAQSVPDYMEMALDADFIGILYHIDIEDYVAYPEDHETGYLIQSQNRSMSNARANKINNGSKISKKEKKYLEPAVFKEIQQDGEAGFLWLGYDVSCDDGAVFAVFTSVSAGNSSENEFYFLAGSREDAVKVLCQSPYYSLY